jgi:hypothetical protein
MIFGHKIFLSFKISAEMARRHKGYTKIEVPDSGFKVQRLQPKYTVHLSQRHLKTDMKTVTLDGFFVPSGLGGITLPFVVLHPSSIVL